MSSDSKSFKLNGGLSAAFCEVVTLFTPVFSISQPTTHCRFYFLRSVLKSKTLRHFRLTSIFFSFRMSIPVKFAFRKAIGIPIELKILLNNPTCTVDVLCVMCSLPWLFYP